MKQVLVIVVLVMVFFVPFRTVAQKDVKDFPLYKQSDSIKIDKIKISKNWITWNSIIKKELLFEEGEYVTFGRIDTTIARVWNMNNFVNVDYEIIKTEEGNVFELKAQDAVKFYPIISVDHSSVDNYRYNLGFADSNFLGGNFGFNIVWDKQPSGTSWNFNFKIPRQLMYKNMTASFGFVKGTETQRLLNREITEVDGNKIAEYHTLMLVPFHKVGYYAAFGNPWHLDYKYRFSPNLTIGFMRNEVDYSILDPDDLELGVEIPEETFNMLSFGVSESIGIINTRRHRKDGYSVSASFGLNLDVDRKSTHHTIGLRGEYHKIFTNIIQVSAWARTGYTTGVNQYQFIKGSGDVIGLRMGEIYGNAFYSAYLGGHFTWVNKKWFSLENAYFVNWGAGSNNDNNLFTKKPFAAVGTSFDFRIPVVSFVSFRLTFMYAGAGTDWFKLNI